MRTEWRFILAVVMLGALAGCSQGGAEQPPVQISKGDTSAICGMYIENHSGPRGEAYVSGIPTPYKFGSTRDLLAFVTDTEMAHQVQSIYVQDTAHIDWKHPPTSAASFVDARKSYYVAWQPLIGSMGPTFASFAKRNDAEAFVHDYGGAVFTYNQIKPTLVSQLTAACPVAGSPLSGMARKAGCVAGASASRTAPSQSLGRGESIAGMPK